MLLVLLEALFFLITFAVKVVFFILNIIRKLFVFILTNSILRFPFILFTLGYFIHINFKILATLYFIYLTHKSALKFNIYKKLSFNLKLAFQDFLVSHKVSKTLKKLTSDHIILNNITVENSNDTYCTIDHLVISKNGVFIIKPLNYFNNISLNFKNLYFKNNKDYVVDCETTYSIINQINNCSSILRDILPYDIPIINVITLPKDNAVVKYDKNYTTPIVTINNLTKFIQNNTNTKNIYTTDSIKNFITENKTWLIDKALFKASYFISNNKWVLGFFLIYFLLFYLYINLIFMISS